MFRAAAILANVAGLTGAAVKASYRGLLGAMARHAERAGELARGGGALPEGDAELLAGAVPLLRRGRTCRGRTTTWSSCSAAHRYHERRCSGRKVASPGLVVRGSVRLLAAVATRLRGEVRGEDLAPSDLEAWRELRAGLERRQAVRAQGRRFRRDPAAYLQELEDALIKGTLPP